MVKSALVLGLLVACATMAGDAVVELRDASFAGLAEKISKGEAITIVTLGGSITQAGKGHSQMIPDWFRKQYPKNEVTNHNVGLSSTCSHSGAFRMESHVLSQKPDLLVAEFAVNDDQDARHSYDDAVKGMEGVVRNAHANGVPVLMILFVNAHLLKSEQAGKPATSVRAHLAVADRYGVPTVNVPKALAGAIKSGKMDWKQFGGVHPNVDGYRFVTGYAVQALEQLLKRPAGKARTDLPEPVNSASYGKGTWVNPSEADVSEEWTLAKPNRELLGKGGLRKEYVGYPLAHTKRPGSTMSFEFEGTAVGAFLLAGPDAGVVEVRIDGGEPREVDLYHDPYSGGLHYPRTRMFADGLKPGKHKLELKVLDKHHPKSKGSSCSILYLSVNR